MIKCPNCGKQNQDHYKYCLGCGNELPRDAAKIAAIATSPTPPAGIPVAGKPQVAPSAVSPATSVPEVKIPPVKPAEIKPEVKQVVPTASKPPAPPPKAAEPEKKAIKCPSCGATIPPDFAFCGRCGTRLSALPPQPPQVVQPPVKPQAVPAPAPTIRGKVVMIQPTGAEGISIPITTEGAQIGRAAGEAFKEDFFLSPQHAKFKIDGDKLIVEDLESLNGIYIRLSPEVPYEIQSGDFIRIGQEVIKFELLPEPPDTETPILGSPRKGAWGKIALVLGKNRVGNAFTIEGKEVLIGRERGNIIFPEDGYVSGLHLKITNEGGKISVTDLKSSNGSYLKIRKRREVKNGDYLLIGQYLYRVDFS